MRTREQLRVSFNNRVYSLVALKWGGSISAGIPKAIVSSSASALAGEAELMLGENSFRRPAPDMFPGVVPGAKVVLESFVDERLVSAVPFVLTDVSITASKVEVSFSNNSLSLSNTFSVAPVGMNMPQGWGRGDGDYSQRWASSLGSVSPGASPGWVVFWAMRAAGYHVVPPTFGFTMVDVPCQWSNISDAWHPNGGHTITSYGLNSKYSTSSLYYEDGMTFMTSGESWYSGTVEGNRSWGQQRQLQGHFMWGPRATAGGEYTVITGGGNWVTFAPKADRGVVVSVSKGTGGSLPAGTIPAEGGYVQVWVDTTGNRWRCKAGGVTVEGQYVATVDANNAIGKETWFTGLKVNAGNGARFAGVQIGGRPYGYTHYLDSYLDSLGRFRRTAFIHIPLTMFFSTATPSVRNEAARSVLDELAAALCGSWWVDESGVCQFRDMRSLQTGRVLKTLYVDRDVSDYELLGEDTASRDAVQVDYSRVAYARNQLARVRVYEGRGATISRDDDNEELISPKLDEEWLAVDWSLAWYNKYAKPKPSLSTNSWVATTVEKGSGSTRQSMERLSPWTYVYKSWAHTDANADFSARYEVDGQKFPLIQARGLMQFTGLSKTYGNISAAAPYVHDGGKWITSGTNADLIGNWLLNLSSDPVPMRSLTVLYDPSVQLGSVVELRSGDNSWTNRQLLVTRVDHDPDSLVSKLGVVEISSRDDVVLTWAKAQDNVWRAGPSGFYQAIEGARADSEPLWSDVQGDPGRYSFGV